MVDKPSLKKYKKLPACDYCKAKRVLCHPQQGASCPRCIEKGVVCVTTPATRRKRRTRAQLEQERVVITPGNSSESAEGFGSPNKANHQSSNSLERWKWTSTKDSNPIISLNMATPGLDLPPSLVRELFQDFRLLPQFYYPLLPLNDLETSLNNCSWNLHALLPLDRVLAQCIIATSSRISTSSHLVNLEGYDLPKISMLAPLRTRYLDYREVGRRRENICEKLKAEAVRSAQYEGVMHNICVSNAVSLALLEFLEYKDSEKGANIYSTAYIHHLRELSEDAIHEDTIHDDGLVGANPIVYSALLMGLALCAATTGKSIPFTYNDELLLCGEDRTSLEQILNVLSIDSVVATPIFAVLRPMCIHVIHLAREISETLTGAFARRHSLNEVKLCDQLKTLDLLHSAVASGVGQMHRLRDTVDEDTYQKMRFCAYPLIHAWGSLVLLVFNELKRRRELIRLTEVDPVTGSSRPSSRFDLLYLRVRSMSSQAALEVAESLEEVPTLTRLTHMNFDDLKKWSWFLLEDADVNDLGVAQRTWAIERFRDGLSLAGFSWVDRTGTVEAIDQYLTSCAIQETPDCIPSIIWTLPTADTENERFISDWLQIGSLHNPILSSEVSVHINPFL
ncbi:hypothetical protein F5879DRAFT_978227 [Lentinula edodes]|nr:hypothetical protein F5879DRAFT_978227 [Lentinula edodes]